mmetsp:Transcript_11958/g.32345  ORF Transcript_11958/g.32345 Transcript_11958/m.32345 type:complete len:92 (+) Transcript_11958:426-701(+)
MRSPPWDKTTTGEISETPPASAVQSEAPTVANLTPDPTPPSRLLVLSSIHRLKGSPRKASVLIKVYRDHAGSGNAKIQTALQNQMRAIGTN